MALAGVCEPNHHSIKIGVLGISTGIISIELPYVGSVTVCAVLAATVTTAHIPVAWLASVELIGADTDHIGILLISGLFQIIWGG